MKLQVYIVDDHALFATTLGQLIEGFDITKSVKMVYSATDMIALFKESVPDIAIVDFEMPGINGLDLSMRIVREFPKTRIIMLSMHNSPSLIYEAIETGIHAFLLKNVDPDELETAMKSVVINDFYHNELTAKALTKGIRKKKFINDLYSINLTAREKEVLKFICDEYTMREIGERLSLSENTIRNHRQNLQKKLNVNNSVGLVKKAIEIGLYQV